MNTVQTVDSGSHQIQSTILEAFVDTCPAHFSVSDTVAHLNILFTTTTLAIGTVCMVTRPCERMNDMIHRSQLNSSRTCIATMLSTPKFGMNYGKRVT